MGGGYFDERFAFKKGRVYAEALLVVWQEMFMSAGENAVGLLGSALLLGTSLALAGCGGGSGVISTPTPTPTPTSVTGYNIVSPPAAATAGANPPTTAAQGFQTASSGGPDFATTGAADNLTFALTQTAVTRTTDSTGETISIGADTATNSGGATIVFNPGHDITAAKLSVPSLGIDNVRFAFDGYGTIGTTGQLVSYAPPGGGLSYVQLGSWTNATQTDPTRTANTLAFYIFGFQTPIASMPATGTATYNQVGGVTGLAFLEGGELTSGMRGGNGTIGGAGEGIINGDGTLTANFATGLITGSFTNMTSTTGKFTNGSVSCVCTGTTRAWNDISLTGTISGAAISGTTSISSNPNNATSFAATGSGTISGGFYGPAANEVGLVWTVQDSNKSIAMGTFGAPKTSSVPSDRRLKRAIRPVRKLGNGLQIYSWRYLGSRRRYSGVMAQELLANPTFAAAVDVDFDGVLRVDYAALGLTLPDFAAMAADGERAVRLFRQGGGSARL